LPPRRPIRERQHRLPRSFYRGPVTVAFTARVEDGYPLFRDPAIVAAFRPMVEAAVDKYGCIVPVHCFMPEHLHVIVRGQD
jgi:hypothetical protein